LRRQGGPAREGSYLTEEASRKYKMVDGSVDLHVLLLLLRALPEPLRQQSAPVPVDDDDHELS